MILCGECRVGMWLTAGMPTCPRCGETATVKLAPTVSGRAPGNRQMAPPAVNGAERRRNF
jgi:hypothetical protein